MTKGWITLKPAVILIFALVCACDAQDTSAIRAKFETSFPFHVALKRSLSSSRAKVGDKLELKYFGEVKRNGSVVLGKDAKLFGVVTEAVKHDKEHPEARLAIRVEQAEYEGKTIPLALSFCGGFRGRPRMERTSYSPIPDFASGAPGSGTKLIIPTGLPDDAVLVPSSSADNDSVLLSRRENISVEPETSFLVCELVPKPSAGPAVAREVVVPSSLPTGVRLTVVLRTALDTNKSKAGEQVTMSLDDNLIGPGNTLAIPKGATIKGRILSVDPGSKQQNARLSIVADSVSWPGGSVPLHGYVEKPPLIGSEIVENMAAHLKDASVDFTRITVEQLPDNGTALVREKKPIRLPIGTVLFIKQSE